MIRWSQRQCATADRFWATWRNREWKGGAIRLGELRESEASPTEDTMVISSKTAAANSHNRDRVVNDGVQGGEKAQRFVNVGVGAAKISEAEIEPAAVTNSTTLTNAAAVELDLAGPVTPGDDPSHDNALLAFMVEIPKEENAIEGKAEACTMPNAREAHNQDNTVNSSFAIDRDVCVSEANTKRHEDAEGNSIADKDTNVICVDGEIKSPETTPDGINQGFRIAIRKVEVIGPIAPEPEPEPAMNELVVFVGSGTALHLATLRLPSPTEFVDLRRTSGDTLQTSRGEEPTHVSQHNDEEAGWLRALENSVGENETVDLFSLGATVGNAPGGVAVLCLAHDSMIAEETELHGLVRAEVLTSATKALVKARRRMRTIKVPARNVASTVIEHLNQGAEEVAGASASPELGAAVAAVAIMEATVEMEVFGEELCDNLSIIFSCQSNVKDHQSLSVHRALQNHRELLSPASMSALTAILSARGRLNLAESVGSEIVVGASETPLPSPGGDAGAWRPVLMKALVAVRTASLEHAVMWAASCDLEKVEYVCKYDVESVEVGACGGFGEPGERREESHAADKMTWRTLQRVSGLGLSAVILLAATSPDEIDMSRRTTDQTSSDNSEKLDGTGCGGMSDLRFAVISLIRLLSPSSLENIASHLSQCSRSDEKNGVANILNGSEMPAPQHAEVHHCVPGYTAIEDLSGIDDDTLTQGAHELLAALDADSTGALPLPEVLLALQSRKAGLRLEPAQANAVLYLAGGYTFL